MRYVITCQNFQFWQVCSSDGLSVCLSVRLFVCLSGLRLLAGYRSHHLTNHHQTWPKCVSWSSLEPLYYLGQRSNNWVTRSKSRSIFKITITLLIFKLQRRSKAQNVGNALGYQFSIPNEKVRQDLKISSLLKISKFCKISKRIESIKTTSMEDVSIKVLK